MHLNYEFSGLSGFRQGKAFMYTFSLQPHLTAVWSLLSTRIGCSHWGKACILLPRSPDSLLIFILNVWRSLSVWWCTLMSTCWPNSTSCRRDNWASMASATGAWNSPIRASLCLSVWTQPWWAGRHSPIEASQTSWASLCVCKPSFSVSNIWMSLSNKGKRRGSQTWPRRN